MSATDLVRQLAPAYKLCADCHKTLPSTAFHARARYKGNLCPRCIICERVYAKLRRDAHPERMAAYKARWLEKRPGYKAEWQRHTPALRKARGSRYADSNIVKERPSPDSTKACTRCKRTLSLSEFGINSRAPDGRVRVCKRCTHAADRRRKFGISEIELADMLQRQGEKCPICKTGLTEKYVVDHCHQTGRVRALLCSWCNCALGLMQDDPRFCEAAAQYLRSQPEWQSFMNTKISP